jgi:ribonucleoside-diphosphate reductase beta chain
VAREVVGFDPASDAAALTGPELRALFERLLPAAADAVARDAGRLPEGVALYHLVLEGVVFAAGQERLVAALEAACTLPATLDGARRVQADERWHVGLGIQCLAASGTPLPVLDEPLALAAASWADAPALARHRRRVALLA